MKYVLKTLLCTVLVMVMAVGLTACGNKVGDIEMKEGESAIYIDEDGTVSYGVSEKFAEDYYNEDDLQKKIDAEIITMKIKLSFIQAQLQIMMIVR